MNTISELLSQFGAFVAQYYSAGSRLYWVFLLSALILAGYVYLQRSREDGPVSLKGFIHFLFPKSVWFNKSALVDYRFFIIVVPLWAVVVTPSLLSSASVGASIAKAVGNGTSLKFTGASPLVIGAIYTVAIFLADDFRRFFIHFLFHRVQFLWEFHKVHHTAAVLTPITVYREHPVFLVVSAVTGAILVGTTTGIFLGLFGEGLNIFTALGINVCYFLFNVLGSNLRHMHIWLSWGPRLEKIFISPAQHQIHHSDQSQHFDKNMGAALAIWDWIFGTLYVTHGREEVNFGLPQEERWFNSVTGLIFQPFMRSYQALAHPVDIDPNRYTG